MSLGPAQNMRKEPGRALQKCREEFMEERELAIHVEGLSKVYKLYNRNRDRLLESLGLARKPRSTKHYALRNVDLDIYKGETVGIIGTNGSGKSTILKIITGVLHETEGTVQVNGRISALLELGAGFNMEYNGIENIYLNGTMIGFSEKEIDEKLQDILDFADIGDYVYQPVKTYSSGMFVKLAFAVAARDGDKVIIDGLGGNVLISPSEEDTLHYSRRATAYSAWQVAARNTAHWPADTTDALRVGVLANIERPHEARELSQVGADGIGLYRTEFAFLRETLPTEEELYAEYATVVQDAPGRAIIRTLDCGADKLTRAQQAFKEPNPALGLRGIRFTLHHQDLFRAQLRALLRAGRLGKLSILLPMISTVEEVRSVRRLIQEVDQELTMRNVPHASRVPLGVMIETPAAVLITDVLARECDFFSIGSNDLIHYLMAIDRNNRHVAYLGDAMHPAVIRSLKRIIDSGHREGLSVSACGELSSDPFGVVLMLGMGIDSLSVSPSFLPGIKHLIRKLDAQACTELATQVLLSMDIPACKHMVNEMLQKVLGHELSFMTSAVMGGHA